MYFLYALVISAIIIGEVNAFSVPYSYAVQKAPLPAVYPYGGDIPAQGTIVQGFIRYLDNYGIEHILSYTYPKPIVGKQVLHRNAVALKYDQANIMTQRPPLLESPVQQNDRESNMSVSEKAREAHFRAWIWQQYQALKREMDALNAQGGKPSNDMLSKYQALEKLALTNDYHKISENPDIKQIITDHMKVWQQGLDTAQSVMSIDKEFIDQGNKAQDSLNKDQANILSEAATQKPDRQNDRVTQSQSKIHDKKTDEQSISENLNKPTTTEKPIQVIGITSDANVDARKEVKSMEQESAQNEKTIRNDQTSNDGGYNYAVRITDTPEVQRAREEHLRIYNQIKSHFEQKMNEQQEIQQMPSIDIRNVNQESEAYGDDTIATDENEEMKKLREAERNEEKQFLEMESIREAQRLQEQQQLLEMEKRQEAERLLEEKRQMQEELMNLRLEDERRLHMERLLEMKLSEQNQEQIKIQLMNVNKEENVEADKTGNVIVPALNQQYNPPVIPPVVFADILRPAFPAIKPAENASLSTYGIMPGQQKAVYYVIPIQASGSGAIHYIPVPSALPPTIRLTPLIEATKTESIGKQSAQLTGTNLNELAGTGGHPFEAYNMALKKLSTATYSPINDSAIATTTKGTIPVHH